MSENDVSAIKERLTALETSMKEKWEAHDKRASERWVDLMDKIHSLETSVKDRPCEEHLRVVLALESRVKAVEKWQTAVNWAVGVIYAAVIGSMAKLFR